MTAPGRGSRSRAVTFANVVAGGAALVLLVVAARVGLAGHRGVLACAGAGALFYGSSFFWAPARRVPLALLTLSLAFSLYAAEVVLTLTGRKPTAGGAGDGEATAPPPAGVVPERRSKLQVVDDLRAAGVPAWPSAHPAVFVDADGIAGDGGRILPLGGISSVRTVYCNEGAGYLIFDADEHGFNNPPGLHRAADAAGSATAPLAALIGDSFTQGACVHAGEDVGARLRAAGVPALNLGNGGDGPLLELATLAEYARPLRPRVVLWLYYEGNDFWDLEIEQRSPTLLRYLEGDFSAGLTAKQAEIDRALEAFASREKARVEEAQAPTVGGAIVHAAKLSELRARLNLVGYPTPSPLFRRTIGRARQMVDGWGGRLYFVYLPMYARYVERPRKVDRGFHSYAEVLAIAAELGLPVIDFQEIVAREADPRAPFSGFGHYNASGYALLATSIAARLREDRALE